MSRCRKIASGAAREEAGAGVQAAWGRGLGQEMVVVEKDTS